MRRDSNRAILCASAFQNPPCPLPSPRFTCSSRILVALPARLRFLPCTPVKGRILIRTIPIFIALLVVFFQRCTAEKIVNDAGRTVLLGMNPQQEAALGMQAYRQVLSESHTINGGATYEMVMRCAERLEAAVVSCSERRRMAQRTMYSRPYPITP